MIRHLKYTSCVLASLCASPFAWSDGRDFLEAFEAYLATPAQTRAPFFFEGGRGVGISLRDQHLCVTAQDPNPYLAAFLNAPVETPLTKLTLSGPQVLDTALLPEGTRELCLNGCPASFAADDALIEGIGARLPDLHAFTLTGQRYFPVYARRHASPPPEAPLRPTFTRLSPLKNLHGLCLETLKFTHLPEDIGELTHLETLSLSRNYDLVELPKSLSHLRHLRALNVAYTHLHELPAWIPYLYSLRDLSLGYLDDQGAGVRPEWTTPGLTPWQGLTLPLGALLGMEGLVIHLWRRAAHPYLETATRDGLTRTYDTDTFTVLPRAQQSRASYLWSSYGLPGLGPRRVLARGAQG